MILITDLSSITTKFTHSVITLGNFDGLHLGHQELIKMVIKRAKEKGAVSLVVTFRPHPLKILAPAKIEVTSIFSGLITSAGSRLS